MIELIFLLSGSGNTQKGENNAEHEQIENLILIHSDTSPEGEEQVEIEVPKNSPLLQLSDSPEIRVVIKNSDFSDIFHDTVEVTCAGEFVLSDESSGAKIAYEAGERLEITSASPCFLNGDVIQIIPRQEQLLQVSGIQRHYGIPCYRGCLEVRRTDRGLVLINQLPFEEYLYSCVPSEMPSSYPMEALKAQAISARTYAFRFLLSPGYPEYEAHLDDSTTYQVYNNIKEQDSTNQAVDETRGQILFTSAGELTESYYYSTSCGVGADGDIWGNEDYPRYLDAKLLNAHAMEEYLEECKSPLVAIGGTDFSDEKQFEAFITCVQESDFESRENWYRWKYQVEDIDMEELHRQLKRCSGKSKWSVQVLKEGCFTTGEVKPFTCVERMVISERGRGGNVQAMILYTDSGVYQVQGGQNIRELLLNDNNHFQLVDGSTTTLSNMLPSSFFILDTGKVDGNVVGYTIVGGGLGHGVGMSQNGAKNMAYAGYTAQEILTFFYNDCLIYAGG
ncbi:MAG: SpoIID/LytB domain-containing protein [Lachnospiraceae bacterium]|nr:SpoIID/LytB domain-containing protein [Lachnospiraceae bacterium]